MPSTKIGVGPTEARETLTDSKFFLFELRVTETPVPTTAISISFLGINLM